MLELLILGASNEIMGDGYTRYLRAQGWKTRNWSIGGCGSSAGVYSLLRNPPEPAELALLSFEINEFATLEQEVRTEEEIADNWAWMVHRLRSQDTVPVLLVLPRSRAGRFFSSRARDLQRSVAERLDMHFIDFTDIFLALQEDGHAASRFMRDDSHIDAATSEVIGEVVQRALRALNAAPREERRFSIPTRDMRFALPGTTGAEAIRVQKGNSLMTGEFLHVAAPDACVFEVADGEFVSALGLNRGVPGANVRILGANGESTKGLTFCADEAAAAKFMFIVSDLKVPPRPRDGVVRLEIVARDAPLSERTLQRQHPMAAPYGCIEVEGAIVVSEAIGRRDVVQRVPAVAADLMTGGLASFARDSLQAL